MILFLSKKSIFLFFLIANVSFSALQGNSGLVKGFVDGFTTPFLRSSNYIPLRHLRILSPADEYIKNSITTENLDSGSQIVQLPVLNQCGKDGFGSDSCAYHALKNGLIAALYPKNMHYLTNIIAHPNNGLKDLKNLLNDSDFAASLMAREAREKSNGIFRAIALSIRENSAVKNYLRNILVKNVKSEDIYNNFYTNIASALADEYTKRFCSEEKINYSSEQTISFLKLLIDQKEISAPLLSMSNKNEKDLKEDLKSEKILKNYFNIQDISLSKKYDMEEIIKGYSKLVAPDRDFNTYSKIFALGEELVSSELEKLIVSLQELLRVEDLVSLIIEDSPDLENAQEEMKNALQELQNNNIYQLKERIDKKNKTGLFIIGIRNPGSKSGHWISLVVKKESNTYKYFLTNSQNNEKITDNPLVKNIISIFEEKLKLPRIIEKTYVNDKMTTSYIIQETSNSIEKIIRQTLGSKYETDIGGGIKDKLNNYLAQKARLKIDQKITTAVPGFLGLYLWQYKDKDTPRTYKITIYPSQSPKGNEKIDEAESEIHEPIEEVITIRGGRPHLKLTTRGKVGLVGSLGALALAGAYKLYSYFH